jgi:hypothetical protein
MSFSPAPLDLDTVLDARWLSMALSQGRDPVEVTGFNVVETLGPSALKIRLVVDFAGAPPAGMPRELCIKGIFDPKLEAWLKSGAQQAEANFYAFCAPRLGVRVPRSFYAGFDPETMGGMVIMEDLVVRGAHFLSALSPYTPEQASQSLDQLARLHGGTWNEAPDDAPWVTPKLAWLATAPNVSPERLTELMHGERGETVDASVRDGPRIFAAIGALAARDETVDRCFIHGDAHAGNVWEHADGIGLIDWQLLQRANWTIDVAYHIAAALSVEDRQRSERDLLDHYLDRLASHGGPRLDREIAWTLYRETLPYSLLMWGMTQRVDPAITHEFVKRTGTAVTDHASFALLGV